MKKGISILGMALMACNLWAQQGFDSLPASVLNAFSFRNIGPACTGGRIVDLAVNPADRSEYYVAAAYSGVWKTTNSGVTFQPVFDGYGTQSIGCLRMDPQNHNTIWVGTGENNNQRSVGYGNGVYKSVDGGKSFTCMGLKQSEHICMIQVDPENSNVVYVAAYGPLWKDGGERGVYKTTDGGKTWNLIHSVSDKTGCSEIAMDPSNPNILYATYHQRRRHEWTYLGGGPESGIYKSTDAGATWRKLAGGLPGGDLGRLSVALTAADPDRIYLMVEAQDGKGGMFVSHDKGESWSKLNSIYTAGNYYCEITADQQNPDRVFILDTYLKWSLDGGKTVSPVGEQWKHVDNHVVWVDPTDGRHLRVGCDGGLYETFDNGGSWDFKDNLPIVQFYRVTVDNAKPWYHIYGGTQDNNTLGGPAANGSENGIPNSEWFVTVGGDGFKSQVDPVNPDIVYSQWQYGGLIRFDRRTGEQTDIKPQPARGASPERWNWDAPLIVSSHDHKRLYFGSNKIWRTDDQGNSWHLISGDLSRGIDRNKLPVMGRVWGIDAVAKNQSTSIYGNLMYLSESPLDENMILAGTDDGLVQLTTDGGKTWTATSKFPGVPDMTLVSCILASQHNKSIIYASFDNHRSGDFKPYVMKSNDGGKTWVSIASNLPQNGSVKCIAEDFVNKDMLFLGTEGGLFVSTNGGKKWTQWTAGLPPVPIKDIAIQKEHCDLALATFGRGFAILDNYAPLRSVTPETLDKKAFIYPAKEAKIFIPKTPYGGGEKGNKGASWYTAPNPYAGAVVYYSLKDDYKTIKKSRQEREAELQKAGKNTMWPSKDSIILEAREESPFLIFVIRNQAGQEVRRLKAPASKGLHTLQWDLRYMSVNALSPSAGADPYTEPAEGPFVSPGTYTIQMYLVKDGNMSSLDAQGTVTCSYLTEPSQLSLPETERHQKITEISEVRKNVAGANEYLQSLGASVNGMKKAIFSVGLGLDFSQKIKSIEDTIYAISLVMGGNGILASHEFETEPGLVSRIENVWYSIISCTNGPTISHVEQFNIVNDEYQKLLDRLRELDIAYASLCGMLDKAGVPYTQGRKPFLK